MAPLPAEFNWFSLQLNTKTQGGENWSRYQDQPPHPLLSSPRAASHSKNVVQFVSDFIGLPTETENYVIGVTANWTRSIASPCLTQLISMQILSLRISKQKQ